MPAGNHPFLEARILRDQNSLATLGDKDACTRWMWWLKSSSPRLYFQGRHKYSTATRVKIDALCAHVVHEYEDFDGIGGIVGGWDELPACFVVKSGVRYLGLNLQIVTDHLLEPRHPWCVFSYEQFSGGV